MTDRCKYSVNFNVVLSEINQGLSGSKITVVHSKKNKNLEYEDLQILFSSGLQSSISVR